MINSRPLSCSSRMHLNCSPVHVCVFKCSTTAITHYKSRNINIFLLGYSYECYQSLKLELTGLKLRITASSSCGTAPTNQQPHKAVLSEKLTVAHLSKKFHAFCGILTCVHKRPPSVLSRVIWIHKILTFYFLNVRFNIILTSTSKPFKRSLISSSIYRPVVTFHSTCTCHQLHSFSTDPMICRSTGTTLTTHGKLQNRVLYAPSDSDNN